jgi:hypothetical protein
MHITAFLFPIQMQDDMKVKQQSVHVIMKKIPQISHSYSQVVSTPASYSGSLGFKSGSGDWRPAV